MIWLATALIWLLRLFEELIVQPLGVVIAAAFDVIATTTNKRSSCCTPVGVFMMRVVPLTRLFVVDDRSLIGVICLSVAVTVQLGVVDGFSVS